MSANASAISVKRAVKIKSIALPSEHGSWGFLFEPLVAAVAVAPSVGAAWFFVMIVGAFMARQPLKILLGDIINKRWLPQTSAALKFTLAFGLLSLIGLGGAVVSSNAVSFVPLAFVMPFALWQIYADAHRKSRSLSAELLGGIAISSSSAAIALSAGWTLSAAIALWAIFAVRLITSIIYVRQRLLLEKGKPHSLSAVVAVNLAGLLSVASLAVAGAIPALPAGFFAVLTARALIGVSPLRRKVKAMKIGVYEVVYGTLLVAAVIIGYVFKI